MLKVIEYDGNLKEIAQKLNITLAGFVRGERMNIYTEPQRIIFE